MMEPTREITLSVNGSNYQVEVPIRYSLADCLREILNLTGTHLGCEHGFCGACTVLVNNKSIRSCLMLAVQADGSAVLTIEGLAEKEGSMNPLQRAFHEHHALQCGFCTPGFLMTVTELFQENPNPSEEEIKEALSGNICRCTGYHGILDAVKSLSHQSPKQGTMNTDDFFRCLAELGEKIPPSLEPAFTGFEWKRELVRESDDSEMC